MTIRSHATDPLLGTASWAMTIAIAVVSGGGF